MGSSSFLRLRSLTGGASQRRCQEVTGYRLPPHRRLHQAAHPRGRQLRRPPIGEGLGQGQGHRHFPEIGGFGTGLIGGRR